MIHIIFYFRQINVLIILNILKHRLNTGCPKKNDTIWYHLEHKWCHFFWDTLYMSSLEVSKLSFAKAQLYGLGFANATFYFSSFKLLVLFTST